MRARQVDGSCDHFQIYSGQSTVNGGTPIFDSITTDLQSVVPISLPSPPTTTSISPASLPTSSSPQLITIYGTNFKPAGDPNASTLIFHDPANNPYVRTPTNVTANSLQYYVNVQSATGTWSVIVTNAGSAASNPQTFTVYTPAANTGSLVVNLSPSGIGAQWQVNGTYYNSGSLLQLTATPATGYHFTSWSGDASGSVNPTTITLNANKNVTANFATGDPNLGTISVTILPSPAVTAGAQWKFNSSGWMNSGSSATTVALGANQNYLQFQTVPGWITPSPFYVTVGGGQTTNVTVTYQQDMTPGLLTVILSPPQAISLGAHWHVNGGTYGQGASVSLSPGTYTVTFDSVSGWTAPASQSVIIQPSGTQVISGTYTPPAGQPVIISISPPIGPNAGGTVMTINGANFATTTNVLIGGKSASNLAVASATQITCLIPPSTTNGSVPVVVQTTGGSATNSNGFAYGIARGNKLDFVSAIGGSCFGVAVNGNYAYIGEGRNFLVLDISQSTPSKVGYVTLPGVIKGIALLPPSNQYTYVADYEGGLQVVDISSPTTPKLAGFYSPTNQIWSSAITIFGGRAYVADATSGLQIFDLGNPTMPALLSSTNVGSGVAIVVKGSVNGVFAYVSTWGSLCIVDVSNPLSPVPRGQTSINGGYVYSLAMSGNYIYATSLLNNLEIIDVSNTNAPSDVGHAPSILMVSAVTSANGYIYAASELGNHTLYTFSPSGSSLTLLGQTTASTASTGYNILVSGTKAYVSGGSVGLEIVDVSNPYSQVLSSSFTDSGVFRPYNSVAVTGNSMSACGYPEGTIDGFNTIFDVSNPSRPTFAANPNAGGSFVLAKNGLAYVLNGNSNSIFNVSTPSSPTLVKLFANTAIPGIRMSLAGNMLYVVGDTGGASQPYLAAIDVSTPSSPVIRGTKTFTEFSSGQAYAIAVNGTKALVGITASENEVITLDISNIATPVEKGAVTNLPYYPKAIQFSQDGNYGYVLMPGNPSTLYVLNVSQLTNPTIITNITIDSVGGTHLQLQGNTLYVVT